MPAISPGAILSLEAASRTLTFAQLASMAWRQGNPPYTSGATYPWGNPALNDPTMQWMAGYFFTQSTFAPTAPNAPSLSGLANELAFYENGAAITLLGGSVFSVVNGRLVVQPRLATAAEVAAAAATPSLAGRPWLSGAAVAAPFSQIGGYFEFTAQLPTMQPGLWPAFWLLPVTGQPTTELDILELVEDAAGEVRVTTSVHSNDAAYMATVQQTVTIPVTFDPTKGFNSYGIWIQPDFVTVFINRVAVLCYPTPPDVVGVPMYPIFDLAIAGPGGWDGPLAPGDTALPPMIISDVGAYLGTITAAVAAPKPAPATGAAAALASIRVAQAAMAQAATALGQAVMALGG